MARPELERLRAADYVGPQEGPRCKHCAHITSRTYGGQDFPFCALHKAHVGKLGYCPSFVSTPAKK